MKKNYAPGLGDDAEVTVFHTPKRYVLVAKWWMRPICWIRRKPTRMEVWR
jgi:hypothetical protein